MTIQYYATHSFTNVSYLFIVLKKYKQTKIVCVCVCVFAFLNKHLMFFFGEFFLSTQKNKNKNAEMETQKHEKSQTLKGNRFCTQKKIKKSHCRTNTTHTNTLNLFANSV